MRFAYILYEFLSYVTSIVCTCTHVYCLLLLKTDPVLIERNRIFKSPIWFLSTGNRTLKSHSRSEIPIIILAPFAPNFLTFYNFSNIELLWMIFYSYDFEQFQWSLWILNHSCYLWTILNNFDLLWTHLHYCHDSKKGVVSCFDITDVLPDQPTIQIKLLCSRSIFGFSVR